AGAATAAQSGRAPRPGDDPAQGDGQGAGRAVCDGQGSGRRSTATVGAQADPGAAAQLARSGRQVDAKAQAAGGFGGGGDRPVLDPGRGRAGFQQPPNSEGTAASG